jgi:hypothetical protein
MVVDEQVQLGAAWRKGPAGPVWLVGEQGLVTITLARWVPRDGELQRELMDVARDSLLNGDGGWRPATVEEAEESVALWRQAAASGDEQMQRITQAQHGERQPDAVPEMDAEAQARHVDQLERSAEAFRRHGRGYRDVNADEPAPFSPTDEARTCVPHGRRDCEECTQSLRALAPSDRDRVADARAVVEAFDPSKTNGSLRLWLESIERGEVSTDDDHPLLEPEEMRRMLSERREAREERWRRQQLNDRGMQQARDLARRTGHGVTAAARAVLRGDTVQTAQAELMRLAVDCEGPVGLVEEVLADFPSVDADDHGRAFISEEMERRTQAGWQPRAAEEAGPSEAEQLVHDLRSVRQTLARDVPRIVRELDTLLERADRLLREGTDG